jgi:hypothetical protein
MVNPITKLVSQQGFIKIPQMCFVLEMEYCCLVPALACLEL